MGAAPPAFRWEEGPSARWGLEVGRPLSPPLPPLCQGEGKVSGRRGRAGEGAPWQRPSSALKKAGSTLGGAPLPPSFPPGGGGGWHWPNSARLRRREPPLSDAARKRCHSGLSGLEETARIADTGLFVSSRDGRIALFGFSPPHTHQGNLAGTGVPTPHRLPVFLLGGVDSFFTPEKKRDPRPPPSGEGPVPGGRRRSGGGGLPEVLPPAETHPGQGRGASEPWGRRSHLKASAGAGVSPSPSPVCPA